MKTTPETTYFLVGPGGFILSASTMQLVEQGKISAPDPGRHRSYDFYQRTLRVIVEGGN